MFQAGSWPHLRAGVPRRERESHVAQVLDLQTQIDARTFHAAMPEEVTDRFQRRALTEEMHGQRVTETVRTAEPRRVHAGARHPNIEGVTDCGGLDRTPRHADAQEQASLAGLPGSVAQVR